MSNIIECTGYANEKIHTGVICYMCDLWNKGHKEPFEIFCRKLGIKPKFNKLKFHREYEKADLVLFDENEAPLIVIEMKVDSYEHEDKNGRGQTEIEKEKIPNAQYYLYITLGVGEFYYHRVLCKDFKWIKLHEMHDALKNIQSNDKVLNDWRKSMEREMQFRQLVFDNKEEIEEPRAGVWNMYQLGFLREEIEKLNESKLKIDPCVFFEGQGPDTILNLGWDSMIGSNKTPLYSEINMNGYLNFKINLENLHQEEKEKEFKAIQKKLLNRLKDYEPSIYLNNRSDYRKSKKILSLNIGIRKDNSTFVIEDRKKTAKKMMNALEHFYPINQS